MSDKNMQLLFTCLNLLVVILSLLNEKRSPIILVCLICIVAAEFILGIPMIIKDIKAKEAAKQAAQNENEQ